MEPSPWLMGALLEMFAIVPFVTAVQEVPARRRILLTIPRPLRDLEGHALVGHLLERRGYEVLFHTGEGVRERILRELPDAVVLDYLGYESRADEARVAKRLGIAVIVLATVGLWETTDGHARAAGLKTGVTDLIDCYLAWGSIARGEILEHTGMDPSRIHAVGSPRFDFYREPYVRLTEDRESFLKRLGIGDLARPVVLWTTSTNHFAGNWKRVTRELTHGGLYSETEALTLLKDEQTQYEEHSRAVRELARRYPSWNFLVKIHPLESLEPYRRIARGLPNMLLVVGAPIRECLRYSHALLQRGSTTAAEAWMLGKPVLELAIGRFRTHWVTPDYLAGSHTVRDVDEADRALRAYVNGIPVPEGQRLARQEHLRDWCTGADGRAADRCAALIDGVVSRANRCYPERQRASQEALAEETKSRQRRGRRPTNVLKRLLGLEPGVPLRSWKWRAGAHAGAASNAVNIDREVGQLRHKLERLERNGYRSVLK